MESPRLSKDDIEKFLDKSEINRLLSEGLIKKEYNYPQQCEYGLCNSPVRLREEPNRLIIKCLEETSHQVIRKKDDYAVFDSDIYKMIYNSFISRINGLKSLKNHYYYRDGFFEFECYYNDFSLNILVSLLSNFSEKQLFEAIGEPLLLKRPICLLIQDTEKNEESINGILMKMPLGNIIYINYISDLDNDKIIEQTLKWIENITELYVFEKNILKDIINKERVFRINSIDTNPKYLLSAISRLKSYKLRKDKKDLKWREFEDIISIIFHNLYSSDIRYGGHQQEWKKVPDNLFFVRKDNKNEIACIVDTKFSISADLSNEKTEKYIKYLDSVRNHPITPKKIALIFVVLNIKSDSSIKKFFIRIEPHLRQNEYCIILPISSLEFIIEVYLGIILKGKINLSSIDLNTFLENIFDKDYLDNTNFRIYPKLYNLQLKIISDIIKNLCKEDSSIEKVFKEIFEYD